MEYVAVLLVYLAIFILFLLKPEVGFLGLIFTSSFDHFLYWDSLGLKVKIYQVFLLAGLFAFLMMNLLSKKKIRKDSTFVLLILYWLVGFISIGNAVSKADAVILIIIELISIFIYFLILQMASTEALIEKAVKAIILSGNFVALLSLIQVIGYNLGFKTRVMHTEQFSFGRPVGTFYESNWLGAFAMSVSMITIGLLISKQKAITKRYLFITLGLQLVTLFLSMTRAAWIGLGFGLVVLIPFISLSQEKQKVLRVLRFASMLAVVILIIGTVSYFVFASVWESTVDRFASFSRLDLDPGSYSAEAVRLAKMARAFELIKQHPWIGCGPGQARLINSVFRFYDPDSSLQNRGTDASNLILSVTFQRGVLGLFFFLAFLGLLFLKTIRALRTMSDDFLKVALRSVFMSVCTLLFTFMVTENHLLAFFWVQFGLIVSIVNLAGSPHARLENRLNG